MNLAGLFTLPPQGLIVFLLVLVRTSSIFLIAPVLGNANVPARTKVGLSFILAMIFTPFLMNTPLTFDFQTPYGLAVAVLQEIAIGVLIGFLAQILFAALQFAGQSVGMQMGYSMSNVFDPGSHAQVSVMAQLYLFIGVLVFLSLDGHHWLVIALQKSFTSVPLGTFVLDERAIGLLISVSNELFWIALTLMAPVLGVLVLAELAMGIVARIMPQMNIFVASFPVKIGLGIITLIVAFPLITMYMGHAIEGSFMNILKFLS
jgi:flagellar biosynthetic protein FliR